jgi:hypothetical protein
MSALNNAWNNAAQQAAQQASNGWTDPRGLYGNAIQGSQYRQMSQRSAPRKQDMPESLIQEMSDPDAQRYWYQLDPDAQWRLVEEYQKKEEMARHEAIADAYDPNNDEAYSVSLSTAVDLWRVKHGDAWVKAKSVWTNGDFYGELQLRLSRNHCFERMEKHNREWLRLKENV